MVELIRATGVTLILTDQAPLLHDLHVTPSRLCQTNLHDVLGLTPNLRTLNFIGTAAAQLNPTIVKLPHLREISTFLIEFGRHFKTGYDLPSLRTLGIVPSPGGTLPDWEDFLSHHSLSTSIQKLQIISRNRERVLSSVPYVSSLKQLKSLELRGDGVETILQAAIDQSAASNGRSNASLMHWLSLLEHLTIMWYDGAGDVIVNFIIAMKDFRSGRDLETSVGVKQEALLEKTGSRRKLFKIGYIDCPNLSFETRQLIDSSLVS